MKRPRKRNRISYMCVANSLGLTRPTRIIGTRSSRSLSERQRKRRRHSLTLKRKKILTKDQKRVKKMRLRESPGKSRKERRSIRRKVFTSAPLQHEQVLLTRLALIIIQTID